MSLRVALALKGGVCTGSFVALALGTGMTLADHVFPRHGFSRTMCPHIGCTLSDALTCKPGHAAGLVTFPSAQRQAGETRELRRVCGRRLWVVRRSKIQRAASRAVIFR